MVCRELLVSLGCWIGGLCSGYSNYDGSAGGKSHLQCKIPLWWAGRPNRDTLGPVSMPIDSVLIREPVVWILAGQCCTRHGRSRMKMLLNFIYYFCSFSYLSVFNISLVVKDPWFKTLVEDETRI